MSAAKEKEKEKGEKESESSGEKKRANGGGTTRYPISTIKMGDAEWVECKKRSEVWKHFLIDKKNKNKVKCKKCPTDLTDRLDRQT